MRRKSDELRTVEVELRAAQSEIERLLHEERDEHYEARLAALSLVIQQDIGTHTPESYPTNTTDLVLRAVDLAMWLRTGEVGR